MDDYPILHVILHCPKIPQNTGNIGRMCAVLGARLHLVHPLGFTITDAKLKRSGMDYWKSLDVVHHADWQDMAVHHKVADMLLGREIRARRRAVVRFGGLRLSGERPRRHLRTARENPASGGFIALAQPVDFRGDSRVRGCAPDFVVRGRKTRIRQKLLLTSPSGGFLRGAN